MGEVVKRVKHEVTGRYIGMDIDHVALNASRRS